MSVLITAATVAVLCANLSFVPAANSETPSKPFTASQVAPGGFVSLNSGVASIIEKKFALPQDTSRYPVAGLTVFPYYEASPQLKTFLSTNSFMGSPLNQVQITPFNGPFSLPQTDLTHFTLPIPNMRPEEQRSAVKLAIIDKRVKDEVPWMVAHEGGQAIGLPGDNDALALVTAGTMFSACMPRTMILRCGTMWVLTGARPAAVLTKDGSIAIRPYSIAAIETTWFNRMTVADLSGQPIELQMGKQEKATRVSIEKGQERTITESSVASAGSADYVDASKTTATDATRAASSPAPGLSMVSGKVESDSSPFIAGLKGLTPPFTNHKMDLDFQKMLTDNGVTSEMRHDEINKQILQRQYLATRPALNKLARNVQYNAAYGTGVAVGPVPFPKVSEELKTLSLRRQGQAKYLSSAVIETEANGKAVLKSGEAVFVAEQSMQIDANGAFSIYLRPGATVHVVATENDVVAVKNLKENEPGSVKVRLNKSHIFDCAVGGELVVGKGAPDIQNEMARDGVMRRNLSSFEVGGGTFVVDKSDVQLTSLMQFSPLMRKLYKSPAGTDKLIVQDVMKAIIALNMVTSSHGGYKRMPAVAATPTIQQ